MVILHDLNILCFRYDNRKNDGSNNNGQHWSDRNIFGGRVLFSETSKPPSLAMDELQKGDDGVYKCRVDFNLAQTSITRVRLTVIGKFNKKCNIFKAST